jgi:hypothetical protein
MTDLDRWHDLESDNPLTFVGMYQFWAQRNLTATSGNAGGDAGLRRGREAP